MGFAGAARAVEPPALVARVTEIAGSAYERHHGYAPSTPAAPRRQRDLPGLTSPPGDTPAGQPDLI